MNGVYSPMELVTFHWPWFQDFASALKDVKQKKGARDTRNWQQGDKGSSGESSETKPKLKRKEDEKGKVLNIKVK